MADLGTGQGTNESSAKPRGSPIGRVAAKNGVFIVPTVEDGAQGHQAIESTSARYVDAPNKRVAACEPARLGLTGLSAHPMKPTKPMDY